MMPALAGHPTTLHDSHHSMARRLTAEFRPIPPAAVERCIADVEACVAHLGLDPTPPIVERMAREHLTGMLKARPPSNSRNKSGRPG
jgi:hypothetical protein